MDYKITEVVTTATMHLYTVY